MIRSAIPQLKTFILFYFTRVGILAIAFIADVVISRILGPSLKGEYFLIMTFIAQITMIATLGIEYSFPNCRAKGILEECFSEAGYRFRHSVKVVIIGVIGLYFLFESKFQFVNAGLFIFIVPIILLEVVFIWSNYYKIASGEVISSITMRYTRRVFFLLTIGIMWLANYANITLVLISYAASIALVHILFFRHFSILFSSRISPKTPLNFDLIWIKVFQFFLLRGTVYLVSFWRGASNIGYLSIAIAVFEVMLFLPNNLSLTLFSQMGDNESKYQENRNRLSLYLFVLLALQSLIVFIFSDAFINFMYGEEFSPSTNLVKLYAFVVLFVSPVVIIIANSLRYENKRNVLSSLFLSLIVLILFGSWLTTTKGVLGSIVAQCISCIVFLLLFITQKKWCKIKALTSIERKLNG